MLNSGRKGKESLKLKVLWEYGCYLDILWIWESAKVCLQHLSGFSLRYTFFSWENVKNWPLELSLFQYINHDFFSYLCWGGCPPGAGRCSLTLPHRWSDRRAAVPGWPGRCWRPGPGPVSDPGGTLTRTCQLRRLPEHYHHHHFHHNH